MTVSCQKMTPFNIRHSQWSLLQFINMRQYSHIRTKCFTFNRHFFILNKIYYSGKSKKTLRIKTNVGGCTSFILAQSCCQLCNNSLIHLYVKRLMSPKILRHTSQSSHDNTLSINVSAYQYNQRNVKLATMLTFHLHIV